MRFLAGVAASFVVGALVGLVIMVTGAYNVQGCSVLCGSSDLEESVDVDGGAPSGVFDVVAAVGA